MSLMEAFDSAAAGFVTGADWFITTVPVPPVVLGTVVVGGGVFAFWCAINPFPRLAPTDTPVDTRAALHDLGLRLQVARLEDWEHTHLIKGGKVVGRARPATVEPEHPYDPAYVPPAYSHHLPPQARQSV